MKAAKALGLIETVPVAVLATLRDDGSPHLVPIVFAVSRERIVTAIDAKRKRSNTQRRIQNIHADPRVSFLAQHYDDDWSRLWWVRIDGRAEVHYDGTEYTEALAALRRRYEQYAATALEGPVIVIDPVRFVSWNAR